MLNTYQNAKGEPLFNTLRCKWILCDMEKHRYLKKLSHFTAKVHEVLKKINVSSTKNNINAKFVIEYSVMPDDKRYMI